MSYRIEKMFITYHCEQTVDRNMDIEGAGEAQEKMRKKFLLLIETGGRGSLLHCGRKLSQNCILS